MLDVAFGSPTKGSTSVIHAGYYDKPGTVKAKHRVRGNMRDEVTLNPIVKKG